MSLLDDTAREPVAPLFYSLLRRVPEAPLTLLDETAREPVAPLGISNIFPKIITIFIAKKSHIFPAKQIWFYMVIENFHLSPSIWRRKRKILLKIG